MLLFQFCPLSLEFIEAVVELSVFPVKLLAVVGKTLHPMREDDGDEINAPGCVEYFGQLSFENCCSIVLVVDGELVQECQNHQNIARNGQEEKCRQNLGSLFHEIECGANRLWVHKRYEGAQDSLENLVAEHSVECLVAVES